MNHPPRDEHGLVGDDKVHANLDKDQLVMLQTDFEHGVQERD